MILILDTVHVGNVEKFRKVDSHEGNQPKDEKHSEATSTRGMACIARVVTGGADHRAV
jgi:hypothetical protein